MKLPEAVVITEVGPRDGLQNEPGTVATADKIKLINRLSACGYRHIEATSFVHPKWIPALADADAVCIGMDRPPGVEYSALVPNARGLERAMAAGVDAVSVFISASETHNQRNINKSISETFHTLAPVVNAAKSAGLRVRGYVSTAYGCPYEGAVDPKQVLNISVRLMELGVDEVSIGDTIGVAVPMQVTALVEVLSREIPIRQIALHFHDTRGTGLANVMAGLLSGITRYDASIGGLGGCPYAPGAAGNVATDDLVYMLHRMGVGTGIDEDMLAGTAEWLEDVLGRPLPSHARAVARAGR